MLSVIVSCAPVSLRVQIVLANQRYRHVPSEERLVHCFFGPHLCHGTGRPRCEAHRSLDFLVSPGSNLSPPNTNLLLKAHAHISQNQVGEIIQFHQLPASKNVLTHFSVAHGQFCLD